uniref:Uncharacterized protein n=1 Tax=Arundo donax TaxID=35708 RepID=A0A0A9A676_ARUDO
MDHVVGVQIYGASRVVLSASYLVECNLPVCPPVHVHVLLG